MTNPLAIIPARIGSNGVPDKNWKPLAGGPSCTERAMRIALYLDYIVVLSTDKQTLPKSVFGYGLHLYRGAPLHTDACPMIDVVTDALAAVSGPLDQIIVLLQPSTPTRTLFHVREAVHTLATNGRATSVVSVVEHDGRHMRRRGLLRGEYLEAHNNGARRQDVQSIYRPDGTVYAFRRSTVMHSGTIYGTRCLPFVIPRWASVTIDTPDDWDEAERRLRVD